MLSLDLDPIPLKPLHVSIRENGAYCYQVFSATQVEVCKRVPSIGEAAWQHAYWVIENTCGCPGWYHRQDCKHAATARTVLAEYHAAG